MFVVCHAVCTNFDGLNYVRMGADDMIYSFLNQPVSKEFLLFVRERLVFDSPMHTSYDCVRFHCFALFNIFGDNCCINIIHDIGRSNGDTVCAIRIVEQGDAEPVLFQ